ncbi:hypothetical protein PTT_17714 [Pyrenophora teres f. teres 0-1]|uniref:Uncharacterized protein n=1 Tax=Pyrenophora teres f. teres (strain 0-1) TaxID=861557 RepID=E3S538_PYRTT|nr:hypothetical protein PTT_17714 [Pyrenophora teres f. teres 0-1]
MHQVKERRDSTTPSWLQRKAKVRKADIKTWRPSNTRKRRLPVHELALLRTTTTDGLPQPGDNTAACATHAAVVDPIEDSQIHNSMKAMGTSQRPRNTVVSKSMLSSHRVQRPNNNSPLRNKLMDSPVRLYQKSIAMSEGLAQPYSGFRNLHDGFVGPELQLTSEMRPVRRVINQSRSKRKRIVVRESALDNGLLPVPANPCVSTRPAAQHGSTQYSVDYQANRIDARPRQIAIASPQKLYQC